MSFTYIDPKLVNSAERSMGIYLQIISSSSSLTTFFGFQYFLNHFIFFAPHSSEGKLKRTDGHHISFHLAQHVWQLLERKQH
jgi:hypothetical protein